MDIDGNILAESLKGEVYPSAIRELELEVKLEAKKTGNPGGKSQGRAGCTG